MPAGAGVTQSCVSLCARSNPLPQIFMDLLEGRYERRSNRIYSGKVWKHRSDRRPFLLMRKQAPGADTYERPQQSSKTSSLKVLVVCFASLCIVFFSFLASL